MKSCWNQICVSNKWKIQGFGKTRAEGAGDTIYTERICRWVLITLSRRVHGWVTLLALPTEARYKLNWLPKDLRESFYA